MLISELMAKLQVLKAEHGDIRTAVTVITNWGEDVETYFVGGLEFVPAKDEPGLDGGTIRYAAHILITDGLYEITEADHLPAADRED